jgi:hypothetical protein
LTWKPLSVREGITKDEAPYEGVPAHLFEPLCQWVNRIFGQDSTTIALTGFDSNASRLASAIRVEVPLNPQGILTVRAVTVSLRRNPELALDAVDAVIHFGEVSGPALDNLTEILQLGGSVWRVDKRGRRLIRRVDTAAAAAFEEASSPSDVASSELQEAWTATYGRNPDASDAWDHSIKAVEAILIPIVTPAKKKATLGDVVGMLDSQGSRWQLALHGHDDSQSVAPLVSMLRLMWPNPDRHGGSSRRKPLLDEAQAVVNLAVTIVQWGRTGVVAKR